MFNGDIMRLTEIVDGLVASKREGNYWDFKREWHENNYNLLHDIICLANNLDRDESYLIFGVDEEADYSLCDSTGDPNRRTTQNLTDWLTKVKWHGGRWPETEVIALTLGVTTIDVIVIGSVREAMPYCLEKPNGKLGAFKVYLRRNDTNTPVDAHALAFEVEALWRHRFGLDLAPLDRVPKLLEARDDWEQQSRVTNLETLYYRFDPRFVIDQECDEDRDGFEYYMFRQCDTQPSWYIVKISYLGQQIYDCLGVALDGGRYFTVVPEHSFFYWANSGRLEPDICYCYFVKGTLDWALHEFFYKDRCGSERIAHDHFVCSVLFFETEDERADFENFLQSIRGEYEERVAAIAEPYIDMKGRETDYAVNFYALQLKQALILKEALEEYRSGRKDEPRFKATITW